MRAVIVSFFLVSQILYASSYVGIGEGKDRASAKKEALADLSQSIKSEVSAISTQKIMDDGSTISRLQKQEIVVSSNLPIMGIEVRYVETDRHRVQARVQLVSGKAKRLYQDKLSQLYIEIKTVDASEKNRKDGSEKAALLQKLLLLLAEYERYRSVALVLGIVPERIEVNSAAVESRLLSLQHSIDSIDLATSLMAKKFKNYKNVYVYPPAAAQSQEITPFSRAVQTSLTAKLNKSVDSLYDAKYLLLGQYSDAQKGIRVSYRLVDMQTKESLAMSALTLQPKAYSSLRTETKNVSFDALVHEGVALSSDLRVSISTNKGSESLMFREGEEIELLVKLNKMGYYYIVGHTQNSEGYQRYIVELNEGQGDQKFIAFVNADDINRWTSLGSFEVEAPFGIESIQVIASTQKIMALPMYSYDEKSGYYVIKSTIKVPEEETRGLKRKKISKDEISQSALTFTTMKTE